MGVQKDEKSGFGPALIIGILLLDVGLLIWGWHLYQKRQENLDDAGLNFSRAPEPSAEPTAPVVAAKPEPLSGIDRYVKKEALPESRPGAAPGAAKAAPAAGGKPTLTASAAAPTTPDMKKKMDRAVDAFFDLKRQPRFKNSKVIQAWKKDFLSYPDLKKVNDEYRKDKDPLKFMMSMVRSPNFTKMAAEYLVKQDMRDFIKEMTGSKAVKESASTFMTDESVATAAKAFGLLGGAPMKDSSLQMQQMKANPSLKAFASGDEPPPAR
ncbi:MAG: hypothetical protein FD126_2555 [Elusimicrobia bacterium]|nr:MAG: hypothetical protein FD126_2555 [Elusimicrobiota bacterium]